MHTKFSDFNLHLQWSPESKSSGSSSHSTSGGNLASDSSDSDKEEGCAGSPRMQRRKKKRNKSHSRTPVSERQSGQSSGDPEPEDLSYVDTLPEVILSLLLCLLLCYNNYTQLCYTISFNSFYSV